MKAVAKNKDKDIHFHNKSLIFCNMDMSNLPELYAQTPRVQPRMADIHLHFRKTTSAHVTALQIHNTSVKADSLDADTSVTTGFIIYAYLKDLIMVTQQVVL